VIRFVIYVLVAIVLAWFGTTVKLGDYTCAGHVKRIWDSEETKDLREGIKQKATSESTEELVDEMKDGAKPVVERLKGKAASGASETAEAEAGDATKDATRSESGEPPQPTK
jgi:hypothetical protein